MRKLQNIVNELVSKIKEAYPILGRDSKQVYTLMFKTVQHAAGQARFSEIEGNLLLTALTNNVETLIMSVDSLLRERITESSAYLKNVINFLERARDFRKPLYIIVCDALSLSEFMFLLYTFHEFVSVDKVSCAVNPSGKTSTFKYLAKDYLDIKALEEVTMKNVSESLRKKLRASGYFIFQDIDKIIHYGKEYENVDEVINSLFKAADKLRKKVEDWLDNKYEVLILADHGYDLVRNGKAWKLTHAWEKGKLRVSPIVPILMVG